MSKENHERWRVELPLNERRKKEDNLNQPSTILPPLPSLSKCIVIVFLGACGVYKWEFSDSEFSEWF